MNDILIGIVGPCGAGKSTLASRLKERGYNVKHIAQEHSYVPNMWKRLTNPDILVYLDVSYSQTVARRKLNWTLQEYQVQLDRLKHARDHSDYHIQTDMLTPDEVLDLMIKHLDNSRSISSP